MKPFILGWLLLLTLVCSACVFEVVGPEPAPIDEPVPEEPAPEEESPPAEEPPPSGDFSATARYTITLKGLWSAQTHPTDFPATAQFGACIGAVHNDQVLFWLPGTYADASLKTFAETSDSTGLVAKIDAAVAAGTAQARLTQAGLRNLPNEQSFTADFSVEYPVFTFVAKIIPSPDWFIGIASRQLYSMQAGWVEELTFPLYAYDAGTLEGQTYTDAGAPTSPPALVQWIKQTPFLVDEALPPVAQIWFQKAEMTTARNK